MTLSRVPVTIGAELPHVTLTAGASVTFTLSGVDIEGEEVVLPATIRAKVAEQGQADTVIELWRNTEGYAGTVYHVDAWVDGAVIRLGNIQVGDDASYNLAELLLEGGEPGAFSAIQPSYTTRAAMIADAALDALPDGSIVYADGWGYLRQDSYTAIVDFPGWRALSQVTPYHFGAVGGTESQAIARTLPDDTVALQRWMACPDPVLHVATGWFRTTQHIYNKIEGRAVTGDGGGAININTWCRMDGVKSAIIVDKDTTVPKLRRTRRLAPETDGGTDDAPISVIIDNQGRNCTFEGFALIADCDYADTTVGNYGANVDVGFFNGCRGGVKFTATTGGMFRIANVYLDVTGSPSVGAMIAPDGLPYPVHVIAGADRCEVGGDHHGGRHQIAELGAEESLSGDYYDFRTDTILTGHGGRGGNGGSDFRIRDNTNMRGPHAPDGRRLYDPTMDPATEDVFLLPSCVLITGRRGSTAQGRIRRAYGANIRAVTNEAGAFVFGNTAENMFQNIQVEQIGTTKNTSGVDIAVSDKALHSYGPLMCKPTSGTNLGALNCAFLVGLGQTVSLTPLWSIVPSPTLKTGRGYTVQTDLDALQSEIDGKAGGAIVASIEDDDVLEVSFDGNISVGAFQFGLGNTLGNAVYASGSFRASTSNNYCLIGAQEGAATVAAISNTALTGTSGVDGQITISSTEGQFWVENRSGGTRSIAINFNRTV